MEAVAVAAVEAAADATSTDVTSATLAVSDVARPTLIMKGQRDLAVVGVIMTRSLPDKVIKQKQD